MANKTVKTEREVLNRSFDEVTESLTVNISEDSINVQRPIKVDGDSVYEIDIDVANSDNGNFSGNILDYFNSLKTVNFDLTNNNPKELMFWFERTVYANAIGLGCDDLNESFGQNITIELLGSGEVVRKTIISNTGDVNSRLISFEPAAFNGFILKFNTTDTICLSNITIRKEVQVVSRIQASDPEGVVVNIGATASGNLKITDAENGLTIAKGDVVGTSFIHKFGEASSIDTGDGFADIWDGSSNLLSGKITTYSFSTTDDIDSISSSDNGDVQLIEIQGLDADYVSTTQTITLIGQTTVSLPIPLIRVFRMINIGNVDLVGEIYLYTNGAATTSGVPDTITDVRAIIKDGNNQTLMAIYTVPAGKTGYMRDWYASLSKNKLNVVSIIHLDARPFGQVFQLKHVAALGSASTSYIHHKYEEPQIFTEKTDILMHASTTVNDSGVAAGFDIVLIDN